MSAIRYLDVCSGYSAFTVANEGLGFQCVGYSEIEAFPRAILEQRHGAVPVEWDHRYAPGSNVKPLFHDFTKIEAHHVGPVDLLIGGTPCQAFSVAGKRLGLDDPRGNLTLEFLALARRLRVPWLAWENVPGFLSHDDGRTMGTFLRLLGELGYGWAYRVLDAQYIRVDRFARAVPQRRRRLFVVAHLGDAAGPAAVLFDPESLLGDPAPRRETGEGTSGDVAPSLVSSGRGVERTGETRGQDPVVAVAYGGGNRSGSIDAAACLTARGHKCDFEVETFVAQVAGILPAGGNRTGGDRYPGAGQETADTMLVAFDTTQITSKANRSSPKAGDPCHPLAAGAHAPAIAASLTRGLLSGWAVRRLTPTECERLMGVPDGFTAITYRGKPAADDPRYKALGNSQAANNMRWIAHGLSVVMRIAAQPEEIAA